MGVLTCERSVDLFGEYVEGTLAPDQRTQLDAHLAACSACSQMLDEYRRVPDLARRATDAAMPVAAAARLRRLLGRAWRRRG